MNTRNLFKNNKNFPKRHITLFAYNGPITVIPCLFVLPFYGTKFEVASNAVVLECRLEKFLLSMSSISS